MILPDPNTLAADWPNASPFPHVVLDHVIDNNYAAAAADEFPPPDAGPGIWHTFTPELERGKQEASAACAGKGVAAVHEFFASDEWVGWLRVATGVGDLCADPDRVGGGIHQSGPGARLGLHVDFNVHPHHPGLMRAVNVILFLTDIDVPLDGEDRLAGALVLANVHEHGWQYGEIIEPKPGRLVVFESGDRSWHGHPYPMTAAQPLRRSIPTYFYRPIRGDETVVARSTRFLDA